MLPFYSSVLTPKEKEEIEEIYPEELTEELSKVKFLGPRGHHPRLGMMGHWAIFANRPHHTPSPFNSTPR